jgi:hypothetical protein
MISPWICDLEEEAWAMQKEKNMGTWRFKYKRKNDEHMMAHVLKKQGKEER